MIFIKFIHCTLNAMCYTLAFNVILPSIIQAMCALHRKAAYKADHWDARILETAV